MPTVQISKQNKFYLEFTNANGLSYSDYTEKPKPLRKWFCRSKKCCSYPVRTTETFNKKTGEMETYTSYGLKNKVLKLEQHTEPRCCPDCGNSLFLINNYVAECG